MAEIRQSRREYGLGLSQFSGKIRYVEKTIPCAISSSVRRWMKYTHGWRMYMCGLGEGIDSWRENTFAVQGKYVCGLSKLHVSFEKYVYVF